MRYSGKEIIILKAFAKFLLSGTANVKLDDLVNEVRPRIDPNETQVNFRGGICASVRNLQRKVPNDGLVLTSRELVGRGNKAEFTIAGPYHEVCSRTDNRWTEPAQGLSA